MQSDSITRARYWVLATTVIVAALQLAVPNVFTIGFFWVGWPLLEIPLALWVFFAMRHQTAWEQRSVRVGMAALLSVMLLALTFNTGMLLTLLSPDTSPTAARLFAAGAAVIAMNVLIFGLLDWWGDAGGPLARRVRSGHERDLMFPQQQGQYHDSQASWQPTPGDYVYTAYTNVFAFSPTDTMPLTLRAKSVFTLQSVLGLLTIVVILGLAVNLLQ